MTKLTMVLRAERTNEKGQKEFFVQSKEHGENYNWISLERLGLIKSNPNVTLKIEMENDPDTLELMENLVQPKALKDNEALFKYVKKNFLENSKINRGNNFILIMKFINTYLNSLKINDLRVEDIGVRSMEYILQESNTLKEFKNIIQSVKNAYDKGKYVIDTYTNMIDDLNVFQEDGDIEEVEEIKQQLKNGTMLTSNLLIY